MQEDIQELAKQLSLKNIQLIESASALENYRSQPPQAAFKLTPELETTLL